ncbi:hypothetical protein [Candidatus Nitrospira bockiana]
MTRLQTLFLLALTLPTVTVTLAAATEGEQMFLQGNRAVLGIVQDVKGDQIQVDTGDVQPRFIPIRAGREKGGPEPKTGDHLIITVNDQNLLVDYHLLDAAGQPAPSVQHRLIKGRMTQPLTIGHAHAVIRTETGNEEEYEVRSQARSKVGSIPIGTPALFLMDETNRIVDVTFAPGAVKRGDESAKKSPIKGAQRRVEGTIAGSPMKNQVVIRTNEGGEDAYEVRPLMVDKFAALPQGEPVVLLIDDQGKVIDVATQAEGRLR